MPKSDNTTPFNATDYDANVEKVIPYYALFQEEIIDLVQTLHPAPTLWLDTGCGTGRLVDKAAAVFPETRFCVADPSAGMLAIARQRLASLNDRVDYLCCETGCQFADRLPEKPQVVSAVLCHHYSQPEARQELTQAVFDLLAPGGLYITFEIIRPMSTSSQGIAQERWKRHQFTQGREPDKITACLDRWDTSVFPITIAEHMQLMQKAGFQTVDLLWASRAQAGFYGIKE